MNGLEFARCTTAGGFRRVLIHAAPDQAKVEIVDVPISSCPEQTLNAAATIRR